MPTTATQTDVKSLCTEMRQYGITLTVAHAWKLLRLVGDRKLVVDALLMQKRPAWLETMVGPKQEKAFKDEKTSKQEKA